MVKPKLGTNTQPPATAAAPETRETVTRNARVRFFDLASSSRFTSRATRQIEALGEYYKAASSVFSIGVRFHAKRGRNQTRE